jgi:hypothetical protein
MHKTQTSPHVTTCYHMWRCLGFWHPTSQLARNLLNFLLQPPHAMTRRLDKFHDFWTSFGFFYHLKSLFPQVTRHVASTRWSRFHVSSWIRPQHTPNNMTIIFWITKINYFMYLQFKFEIFQKIQRNEIN